ncbi:hypothetical protein [Natronococcus sp. A-GB7]|uniref:hypothetical protein n=1 Tax=Natronococcus sp. A-GB7 TaxID=3037649 RepID=UPI00241D1D29|nr:hypothetical protein [Natronococcus sp. A-GB7]MDG5821116.1 hypothetical protein [Natronococcus sp. A-GB7]
MIGTSPTREIVDWERTTDDGTTVYVIEYSEPVPEPSLRSASLFGASSGGTVPEADRRIALPDGEQLPADEVVFDADGTVLEVRHEGASLRRRVRRTLFPWL